jgi:hypothetical protein
MLINLVAATEKGFMTPLTKPRRLFQIGTHFPIGEPPHRPAISTQEARKGDWREFLLCPPLVLCVLPLAPQLDILSAEFAALSHTAC